MGCLFRGASFKTFRLRHWVRANGPNGEIRGAWRIFISASRVQAHFVTMRPSL